MKIDYVILGADKNPLYLDFWPIVSKIWREVFNIIPVLGLITDHNSDFIEDEYGIIKCFKATDNISHSLQSQLVRLFLTTQLQGNLLISDIDMIPLSKQYFIDNLLHYDSTKLYVMSADNNECLTNQEYPMCYILANNITFNDCLQLEFNWDEFNVRLNNYNYGWTTDQRFIFTKINEYKSLNQDKVVLKNRGWDNGMALRRIDRAKWQYNAEEVKNNYYIDSHLPRPFNINKHIINTLIDCLY